MNMQLIRTQFQYNASYFLVDDYMQVKLSSTSLENTQSNHGSKKFTIKPFKILHK